MARSSCSYDVGRELAAGVLADDRLEASTTRRLAGPSTVEVGVLGVGAVRVLACSSGSSKRAASTSMTIRPNMRDEPAVGVPAEALVAGQRDEALEGLLVEAEVEDRVHHARHRELGARADGDEQRVLRVAEALAGALLDLLHGAQDVVPEAGRQLLAAGEVVVAGLGRDREARRGRQAGEGHLGEARALAAEQVLHLAVAFGRAGAPGVDVALGGDVRAVGRGLGSAAIVAGLLDVADAARRVARGPRNSPLGYRGDCTPGAAGVRASRGLRTHGPVCPRERAVRRPPGAERGGRRPARQRVPRPALHSRRTVPRPGSPQPFEPQEHPVTEPVTEDSRVIDIVADVYNATLVAPRGPRPGPRLLPRQDGRPRRRRSSPAST